MYVLGLGKVWLMYFLVSDQEDQLHTSRILRHVLFENMIQMLKKELVAVIISSALPCLYWFIIVATM